MESENSNKIIGYVLLIIGIALILISLWQVYNVFTGKGQPYNLFSLDSVNIDLGKVTGQPNANLTQELVNSDVFNKPLNYGFYLMLMGFVSSVGFKIASLGVQLARTLRVSVKEKVVQ